MTTTNIAEVLKLAVKPVQYDNDENTWLEFRFKLENYLTLVDGKYVALLLNAESQTVANLPTGTEEPAVTIRTLSHPLYALLATLTTGRSLRLVQRVPNRNGFEARRPLVAENAPKTAGAVALPPFCCSDNSAKFEETWKSWEHQVDVYYNKLRAITQACLNTNKTWIVNDFRDRSDGRGSHGQEERQRQEQEQRQEQREHQKWQQRQGQEQKERARTATKARA